MDLDSNQAQRVKSEGGLQLPTAFPLPVKTGDALQNRCILARRSPSQKLGLLPFQDRKLAPGGLKALSPERFSTSHGSEHRIRFPLEPSYVLARVHVDIGVDNPLTTIWQALLMEDCPIVNQHQLIRREYRAVIQSVKELSTASKATLAAEKLLNALMMGWLTLGSEILSRLESKRLSAKAVLRRPALLQRKWFHELLASEKPRWINVFWNLPAKTDLPKILGLSKRRLLQLQQGVKCISSHEHTTGTSGYFEKTQNLFKKPADGGNRA